jgi:hypothetical protein
VTPLTAPVLVPVLQPPLDSLPLIHVHVLLHAAGESTQSFSAASGREPGSPSVDEIIAHEVNGCEMVSNLGQGLWDSLPASTSARGQPRSYRERLHRCKLANGVKWQVKTEVQELTDTRLRCHLGCILLGGIVAPGYFIVNALHTSPPK